MFDTMTLTKIIGAGCGALLVFLLGNWAAELIYEPAGGHEGENASYVIEVADAGGEGGGEAAEEVDFAAVLAAADPGKGERVFSKCKACHKLEDGANGTGPHLYGVVDREVGSVPGFSYSGALKAVADVWSPEHLDGFLKNPKGYAPGTKMGFSGLKDVEDRANLIAYLGTIGG
ncbi:cytochrome c family protein [Brevirhabdus pacifica]|uniref:Cytochrome c family protein n=1 Tax=Brevirhabdus pacifica TaxID=1267768 RepID=A0A1U7DHZ6_9RHOB|nr:cytochrome c family protein [Brevirhabdus pacifica]APX89513.1 cytochrome c family protein [Brevirhabdus pacifica]OWU76479.1 cytochrome C [Loktanella sp. 22II-4b]PJJ85832.1 cytochrome c [Brevirhabdus pacifica]